MSTPSADMSFTAQRATQLLENLHSVVSRVSTINKTSRPVRIVLVSKLKPASDILALHTSNDAKASSPPTATTQSRATHFGENYVQELTEKAALLPTTIKWHFIGNLQSNKCKSLAGIPNLWCVSSVDTQKKADLLNRGRGDLIAADDNGNDDEARLRVMVQVNTSGEESKAGVEPADATALCKYVVDECKSLRLAGLMTIGAIARSKATTAETENEDFLKLVEVREQVCKELGLGKEELELSMGMSSDFEGAIVHGSDEVRIGSTIFGERPPKSEAVV